MKTIFDPNNTWLGPAPMTQLSNSNKLPVAIDDALTVLVNSGPVTIDVLANDFDPEGALLTLISASASLGTAIAETDDTVTYTPPAGISGFDTVIYRIADDLGQQRDGQVNITIADPQLSIDTQLDNTMVINAETGLLDITVTTPPEFAGVYQIDTGDLAGGPINLVPPKITGTVSQGQTLSTEVGLWAHDASGAPAQSLQWLSGGVDISGATGTTYVVQSGDIGLGLSVREALTDNFGQRFVVSAAVGQSFTPNNDAALIGWWDADDSGSISEAAGVVTAWSDKAGGQPLEQIDAARRPTTGSRTLNGLNVLDFDGTAFLEAARTLPANGNVAFHAALIIDTTSNAFEALLSVDAANDFQIDANNAAQFDGRLNLTGIGSSVGLTGGPFSGALIVSAIFDATGAGIAEVFIANTSRANAGYSAAIDANIVLNAMTNRSQNAWVDGAMAELIVTGDVTNRSSHHAYLAAKWGLT